MRQICHGGKLLFGANGDHTFTRRALLPGVAAVPLALTACGDATIPLSMLPGCCDDGGAVSSGAQLGANAATAVFNATFSGPANVYSSAGNVPTLLASLAVGSYFDATTQVVTVTGFVDLIAPGAQFEGDVIILTAPVTSISGSVDTVIARNGDTSTPRISTTFAIEATFSVPANTSQTYYVDGFGGGAGVISGATIYISNVAAKCEVISR